MSIAEQQPQVTGTYVTLDAEPYYRIANSHLMPDFFMSLVGASDHWMFISSHGALTAGRQNADNALFPYASDDQVSLARSETGPTTLIRIKRDGEESEAWEPFTDSVAETGATRNLYKTALGNKLVFEEIHEELGLAFHYRWVFSEKYGFVRSCRLENIGDYDCSLELLDGLRNVLPYGVNSEFMMRFSNLANAYRKSEHVEDCNLGLYLLSSIPSDRAEPSEGLKATTVWQTGLTPQAILLSADQLPAFRANQPLHTESDVRGKTGAFLVHAPAELAAGESVEWHIVAELGQDHTDVIELREWLKQCDNPAAEIAKNIKACEQDFLRIVSSADAMQSSLNTRRQNRHLSNTVFNVMRGGIPLENYSVHSDDFRQHVSNFNRSVFEKHTKLLDELPEVLSATALRTQLEATRDPDLLRLATEYLPLAFSRRHGDPTRPWNRFSIDLRSANGDTNLNYQGNWRDIFQNWEALAVSFPEFSTAMICRFINATTADGYNPYRVTKDGFEWEEPTPDDPWANIGYWGDHQIIYLLKLLEWNQRVDPAGLDALLSAPEFVHANVPYRIKSFEDIQRDPQSTIEFDSQLSQEIASRVEQTGADGKLLRNQADEIHHVNLLEKLLTLSLAKLSNFVPDGGVWLNTQRPEWNDANNALVGNGLSMVTTCYLHRWFSFLQGWLETDTSDSYSVSCEVAEFFESIRSILSRHLEELGSTVSPHRRAEIVEELSQAGAKYRKQLYATGVSGQTTSLSREACLQLLQSARQHVEATIRNNQRPDGLYHAYNLIDWHKDGLGIEHLYEMLEGQVAVLSAGLLTPAESVELLDALRESRLYRQNQMSYMLYPDRQLPRFLEKNQLKQEQIDSSPLLQTLLELGNEQIVRRDTHGEFHFNGSFRNATDLKAALKKLPSELAESADKECEQLAGLFEDVFGHRQFTGRSGTFFAYEGLGSIYWHMVSKLGLAVSENFFAAIDQAASAETIQALREHFQAIRHGIGAEKTPAEYGAFPTDPYSHTPENSGVKQPGMTGQVKEDILSRFFEIGAHVESGSLRFRLEMFDRAELLDQPQEFAFCDLSGSLRTILVPAGGFGFTLCQVPIIYQPAESDYIDIQLLDGTCQRIDGFALDSPTTQKLFSRSGEITSIACHFKELNCVNT